MPLRDKVSHGKRILVGISAGKALVGHVKEGIMSTSLDGVTDLSPLSFRGVNTGRVVRASVEQEDAAGRSCLDVGHHSLKVEANRVLVVVTVLCHFQPRVLHHRIVVGSGRSRKVDLFRTRVEALQEGTSDPKRTRARNGLCDGDTILL